MISPLSSLVRAWPRQPSAFLLLVLGITVVLYPFADGILAIRLLVQVLDIAIVLVIVRTLRVNTLWIRSAWVISVPLILLQCAHLLWPGQLSVQVPMLIFQIVFHAYAVILLLGYVLRDEVITIDELYALACIYVLMALLWASAYALVVLFNPTAIFINPINNPDGLVGWSDLVYYSMTTLTSVGYGEITPVSPSARALAMLQQAIGVLYVAILIARLTGMHRASLQR